MNKQLLQPIRTTQVETITHRIKTLVMFESGAGGKNKMEIKEVTREKIYNW